MKTHTRVRNVYICIDGSTNGFKIVDNVMRTIFVPVIKGDDWQPS